MKKTLCLLMLLCLLPLCATAENGMKTLADAAAGAKGLLTEVYGYTEAEMEDFTFRIRENSEDWYVEFAPKSRPGHAYYASFNKATGEIDYSGTPYTAGRAFGAYYPGEASVRAVLRAAMENKWFAQWDADAKQAFLAELTKQNVARSDDLKRCAAEEDYSAARAIQGFFVSCYGARAAWSAALTEWRNDVLAACGFTAADCAIQLNAEKGVRRMDMQINFAGDLYSVIEFCGEIPEEMKAALHREKLAGYEVESGAAVTGGGASRIYNRVALIALRKGEERLLVFLWQPDDAGDWDTVRVTPIPARALLSGRDVVITFGMREIGFQINYPISDTAFERFNVRPFYRGGVCNDMMCRVLSYEKVDYAKDQGMLVERDGAFCAYTPYDGVETPGIESGWYAGSGYLDYLDADAFPKTHKECADLLSKGAFALPDGFTAIQGVNLRKETSTRSESLGDFETGALVRIIERAAGDPVAWYKVQVGELTGYMSANYVSEDDTAPLFTNPPLAVARNNVSCALKKGASALSGTVMELKAGYQMHVLATCGDWYYVCIPSGTPDWYMDINGAYGYVKKADVTVAATALALDWLE